MEITKKDFSEFVRNMRKTAGLTQKELATRLGVDQSTIGAYESGRSMSVDAYLFIEKVRAVVKEELKKRRGASA